MKISLGFVLGFCVCFELWRKAGCDERIGLHPAALSRFDLIVHRGELLRRLARGQDTMEVSKRLRVVERELLRREQIVHAGVVS